MLVIKVNFYLHQNAPGYKEHIFLMYFDPFRMILTFIVYIKRYPCHPNEPGDLWECGVLGGRRNTMIYAINKVPESVTT